MDWLSLTIETTPTGIEPLTGRLYLAGIQGVEIEDEEEFNEFLEENRRLWDYVDDAVREKMHGTRVRVYLPDSLAGREQALAVEDVLRTLRRQDTANEYGSLTLSTGRMKESDWAESWKQYFKPLKIGPRVLIRPQWEPLPPDTGDRVVFTIEPGMVFGTGAHESTRLCIEAAQEVLATPGMESARVLDLGCGSGILSVIALLLGAKNAVAVDIDPNAEHIARHNADLNGIDPALYEVLTGDILEDGSLRDRIGGGYDLVFANIVADAIIAMAPVFPHFLRPGGRLIASGIIDEREEEVTDALRRSGLIIQNRRQERGWVGLTAAYNG